LEISRTGTTRWNTLKVIERTEKRFEVRVMRCLFHEFALSLGIPEIVPMVCQIDNAVFNSYLPERITFNRGGINRRIADGNADCQFVWEKVE
jgi:hypothetical protein